MDHDLYVGRDEWTGTEYLLRVWHGDGSHELAVRLEGDRTWGPPVTLTRQSAEVSS